MCICEGWCCVLELSHIILLVCIVNRIFSGVSCCVSICNTRMIAIWPQNMHIDDYATKITTVVKNYIGMRMCTVGDIHIHICILWVLSNLSTRTISHVFTLLSGRKFQPFFSQREILPWNDSHDHCTISKIN